MFKGPSYKVTEIEGAGLGIVSTRRILRGEIILQEKPLVLVESKIKGNAYTWFVLYLGDGYIIRSITILREEKTAYLKAKVKSLKKKDREEFYSLFDCKQEEGKSNALHAISNLSQNFHLQVIKSQLQGYFVQIILPSGPLTAVQITG